MDNDLGDQACERGSHLAFKMSIVIRIENTNEAKQWIVYAPE